MAMPGGCQLARCQVAKLAGIPTTMPYSKSPREDHSHTKSLRPVSQKFGAKSQSIFGTEKPFRVGLVWFRADETEVRVAKSAPKTGTELDEDGS